MQFKELSAILKQKRLEQNITQEELAHKLKIPLRGIIALEEGELHELPHETYIRTFTKEYAKLVGLDVDEIRAMLSTVEEFNTQVEPPKSMEAIHAESEPKGAKSKGVRLAVPLLLLALIGTTTYFFYTSGKLNFSNIFSMSWFSSNTEESPSTNALPNNDKPEDKKDIQENKTQGTNTTVKTNELENVIDAHINTNQDIAQNTDQNTGSQLAQSSDQTQTSDSTTTENKKEEEPKKDKEAMDKEDATKTAQADLDFETFIAKTPEASLIDWSDFDKNGNLTKQAIIYVKQDCWMQVIVDGKDGHFTLRAKNQRKFDFNKSLQFKIGNASAVTLFHGYELVDVGDSSVLRIVTLNAK